MVWVARDCRGRASWRWLKSRSAFITPTCLMIVTTLAARWSDEICRMKPSCNPMIHETFQVSQSHRGSQFWLYRCPLLLNIVRTNSSAPIRYEDGYISVWATSPNRLTFWDGAPSLISGIRAMLQALNRMCGKKISGMGRVWVAAPKDRVEDQRPGWLASSSLVMIGCLKEVVTLCSKGDYWA